MKAEDALKMVEEVQPIITESSLKDIFHIVKLNALKGKTSCIVQTDLLNRSTSRELYSLGYKIDYVGGKSYEISWDVEKKEVTEKPTIKRFIEDLFRRVSFRIK